MDVRELAVWPLGERLRELRLAARWTQRGLAEAAGVSVGVVRDLEQGISHRPRPDSLRRLAGALGVPGHDLAAGDAGPPPHGPAGEPVMIQVLGPLRVWRQGMPQRVGGGKQRAVLGLLGLRPDAVVSREAIGAVLWGDVMPRNAGPIIQSHVSRLRAALDPADPQGKRGGLLGTAGSGYYLSSDYAVLDLVTYRRLAERARTDLRAGDAAAACELFEQALAAWRDDPVADVELLAGHPWVTSLRLHRADVLVEYAEAASGQGWHDRVLPHLQALAEHDPLNERAHACLMIALAGAGRQAAALELYEQLRRRLADQLGVEPGAALATAQLKVLRQEIPVAGAAAGLAGLARSAPAGGARLSRPCQLPPAVADFTGRAEQVTQLDAMLRPDDGRSAVPVVVLSGPPGVGKTTLMVHVAHAVRRFFPDGQLWAQLDGASDRPRDPADVTGEFLRSLGVAGSQVPDSAHERALLYRSRLADQRVIVVADDAGSAGQVLPLLPGTAGCAVIVTSRRQLTDVPGAHFVTLSPLTQDEATELVGRIAGQDWGSADPQAAADLVSGCGLLPLALRIAGAKLAARGSASVAALAKAVADERNRLDALQIGDLSVRASLSSGYQSLSDAARRAFRLLALLGPCDVAEWTVATLLGETSAARIVSELCDRSMLTITGTDRTGHVRLRLHDLLRDYASEELASESAPVQHAALRRAHSAWLQLAAAASTRLSHDPYFPAWDQAAVEAILPAALVTALTADPLAWFETERLNLLDAASAACQGGHPAFAARLAAAQSGYQHLQARYDDKADMWRQIGVTASRAGDTGLRTQARVRLGAAMLEHGYSVPALGVLDECVEQDGSLLDPAALANALYWHAMCFWDLGSYERALGGAQRGVALARQAGSRHAECMNLRALAYSFGKLGQHDEALDAADRAVTIAGELADESCLTVSLHTLAAVCALAGEYDRTVAVCRRNLDLAHRLGDERIAALTLGLFGDAYSGLGRHQEAIVMFSAALPYFQEHALSRFVGLCLVKQARSHQALGQHTEAISSAERSMPLFQRLGLTHYEERAQGILDECLAARRH